MAPLYLDILAEGVRLQSVFSIISVFLLSLPVSTFVAGFCRNLLTEGVGLLSVVSVISVFLLSLPVSTFVARVSVWVF